MSSIISSDNTVAIWAAVIGVVCLANWLDQRYKWANKLSIVVLCIVGGMLLGNLHVLPFESPVYDGVSGVLLYVAIPMLLFKSDLRKIYKESGKIFIAFHVATAASLVAALIYGYVVRNIDEAAGVIAMSVGGYIGGTVNSVAMAGVYNVSGDMVSAQTMIGNFSLGIMLFLLGLLCQSKFFRRRFSHPHIDEREAAVLADPSVKDRPLSAAFWKNKEISLLDVLKSFATAFIIVALSKWIAGMVSAANPPFIIKQLFGSIYLVMTTLTVIGATCLPKWFSNLKFGDEFGMIILTMWYTTIGISADLVKIAKFGVLVLFIFFVTLLTHIVVAFPLGKLCKLSLEEICCGTTAAIGGPSSSAALTINQGWRDLIAPTIMCALYGYIIGNYLGVLIGNLFL